jgi:serine/threonine-protein kinase
MLPAMSMSILDGLRQRFLRFLGELRRRHVIRVGVVYTVVGLGVAEAADIFLGNLGAPDWAVPATLMTLLLGLPVTLVVSWVYDLTPTGLVKDEDRHAHHEDENGAGPSATTETKLPATPADRRFVAVLPLTSLSEDRDDEFFADGVTDDIITALALVEGLSVISRLSAMRYKGALKSTQVIAEELGVGTVLEGSVRRSKNRVRISVKLIDASTDRNVWVDTYDRDLEDVFAVQSEVAESVATALQSRLSPRGKERLATVPTRNVEAYELVARARHAYLQVTPDHVNHGMELLRQAIELDPDYGVAWAHLAIAHFVLPYFSSVSPASVEASAREAIDRAFELDDGLPEAYVARAYWKFNFRFDWEGAESDFEKAIELNPSFSDAYQWRALMRHICRRPADAIADARRSVMLDPLSFQTRSQLAQCLAWGGQPEAAIGILQEILKEDRSNFIAHWLLGLLVRPGDPEAALGHFDDAVAEMDLPLGHASRSVALRGLGRTADADSVVRALEARDEGPEYVSPFSLAVAYFGKGEPERALDCLERGIEGHDFLSLYLRLIAPAYGFQDHPQYQAILNRVWPSHLRVGG